MSLKSCYHCGLPKDNLIHLTIKSLLSFLTDYKKMCPGRQSFCQNSQPYNKLFPYTHHAPASLNNLLPKHMVLFFLPKCCSHCSLALKFSSSTQYPTLPSMAPPTLPPPQSLSYWPGRNLSFPQPHCTSVILSLRYWFQFIARKHLLSPCNVPCNGDTKMKNKTRSQKAPNLSGEAYM